MENDKRAPACCHGSHGRARESQNDSSGKGGLSRRDFLESSAVGVAAGAIAAAGFADTALGAPPAANPATAPGSSGNPGNPNPNPGNRPILIKNGVVLTMDPAIGDFTNADVLINGKKIVAVQPNLTSTGAFTIDATNMIVMPGFINTHHHQYQTVFRWVLSNGTYGSGVRPNPNSDYLRDVQGILTPLYKPEDAYAGELVASLGALYQGVTTTIDTSQVSHTPAHSDACIQGLMDSGARAIYAYSSGTPSVNPSAYAFPQDITRLKTQYFSSDDQLVTLFLQAGIDPTLLALARSLSVATIGHNSQSKNVLFAPYAAGLLGPDITYIHCTQLLPGEFTIIAETGGHVSTAGPIEMTMGHGEPVYQKCLDHGFDPSLSTDVEVTFTADSFTQMRTAMCLQRYDLHNRARNGEQNLPPLLTCKQVLGFATVAGAKACQLFNKIGTLTPGKEADIIMLTMNNINVVPVCNAYGAVVTGMDTSNVQHVMVAGQLKKWNGALVGVDLNHVSSLVTASRDRILAQTGWPTSILDTSLPGH
jgi:5-methylthioadenosine/S-adenosylhomocysteine deaminase